MSDLFLYSIGVGVFVRRGNRILLGRRGKACGRGAGCLALPGGHVGHGETIAAAVVREVQEETGLTTNLASGYPVPPDCGVESVCPPFSVPGLLAVTDHNDIHQQVDGHLLPHLSLWVMTHSFFGEPRTMEPDKCDGWAWMTSQEVAALPGVENPTHPQYFWTPIPLWRRILRPYFGSF